MVRPVPLNLALRSRTHQSDILSSIVARLIDQVDELTEDTCWLTDQPIPVTMPAGRYAVTVSIGGGRFPSEFFTGGGADTLTEDGSVVITPLVVTPADRPRRKWKKLVNGSQPGDAPTLLYFKHAILQSLLADPEWEPQQGDQPLLRDMLSPIACDPPRDVRVGETVAAAMQMTFSTVFDWSI